MAYVDKQWILEHPLHRLDKQTGKIPPGRLSFALFRACVKEGFQILAVVEIL
jgi:hypothetical protein